MDYSQILGLSEWSPIARGGLAVVWRARQQSLDRFVAVKVYQRGLGEADRRRFLGEVVALGQLSDHPAIVTAYDAGILPDDRPYVVMELCSGGSLTRWLKADGRPDEDRVREIGVRIADALVAVHARGVLHRDVKPANILLDSYGNPRLADFGLVAVTGSEAAAAEALSVTPAYAPPEAFTMRPVTEFGDVFSLAATMYAVLACKPPRRMDAAPVGLEQLAEAAKEPIEPLATVDMRLMGVLMSALSSDPAARPTAASFRDQLADVRAPGPSRRRPQTGAAEGMGVLREPSRSRDPRDSANLKPGRGINVAAVAAGRELPPHQVGSARRPRWRPGRGAGILAASAALVVVAIASATIWLMREPGNWSAVPAGLPSSVGPSQAAESGRPTARITPGAGEDTSPSSAEPEAVRLRQSVLSAEPFETVRIGGRFHGGADTFLRVQRWQEGTWVSFPLPAKTDPMGRFTAYVELGRPGRYRLRVIHPESGVESKPLVLVIRG